ncbi:hypothetical protein KP509_24G040700 [Ceratopteris richardii]|nr:hypothetical protein KP509_24G040700 [Ceratopteris richardii]
MRTRVSAHQVTPDYIAKYTEAYRRLRSLPSSDPRAYMMQANVHCAFCDNAYDENGTAVDYQVHNSWFFFPWHRWYLYFHERILASLIGDDTFALPFWNWDAPGGYTIPPMFDNPNSTLYDTKRNPLHRNPKVVDLDYSFSESNRTPQQQLQVNNSVMYRQMVTAAKTPSLFFGQSYRQGDSPGPGAGTVENTPHGTVHVWTGNPSNPNDEDMGTLYSAARDPIFFAHHGNVDRLWSIWKTLGGRRTDLTDSDYLQATFEFYDENKNLVRVKIADALQTENLRYNYQNVDIPWVRRTTTRSAVATTFSGPGGGPSPAMAGPLKEKIKEKYRDFKKGLKEFKADLKDKMAGRKLEKTLKALVKRPRKVKAADFDEEILVIEGVQVACDEKVKFDVYINLVDVDEDKVGNDVAEYAGSFVNVPHTAMKMAETKKGLTDSRIRKSNFRLGIGDVLADLDIEDDDDFAVTIVPRGKPNIPVSIDDIRLEYE